MISDYFIVPIKSFTQTHTTKHTLVYIYLYSHVPGTFIGYDEIANNCHISVFEAEMIVADLVVLGLIRNTGDGVWELT